MGVPVYVTSSILLHHQNPLKSTYGQINVLLTFLWGF